MHRSTTYIKAIIAAASCAIALGASAIPSPAATQAWVKEYIESLNGSTNGVISVDYGEGTVSATFQPATNAALMVTNALPTRSALAVTNGTLFATIDAGDSYTNAALSLAIFATPSNFVFNGINSIVTNGIDTFVDEFSVGGARITDRELEALTK